MPAASTRFADRLILLLGGALLVATLVVAAINLGDDGGQENAVTEDTSAVATDTVTIKEFKYMPPAIRVKAGSKVTWVNDDTAGHTASSRMGADIETETIAKGERKTITVPDKPGTYDYICDFHPYMEGRVIVE